MLISSVMSISLLKFIQMDSVISFKDAFQVLSFHFREINAYHGLPAHWMDTISSHPAYIQVASNQPLPVPSADLSA